MVDLPEEQRYWYMHQPRAWLMWRIETTIEGIRKAGYKVRPDYLKGEKTPIAILPLFWDSSAGCEP